MNTVLLNTISLDDGRIIKKGGSGGGVTIKNQTKSVTIAENGNTVVSYDSGYTGLEKVSVKVAIPNEEKTVEITENGTTEVVADNGFLSKVIVNTNVASGGDGTTSKWTGHADADGLKAIGWTDDDIAYYQQHGVNWNEEDDEYHKVTDDNKALYGVLTANNISTYKDRIVYLPKIDTSGVTNMSRKFSTCRVLVAIPQIDTSGVTDMSSMFNSCFSLKSICPMDTSKVTNMSSMFYGCRSLEYIPPMDTSKVTNMSNMFNECSSIIIPPMDTSNVTNMGGMFYRCHSLTHIELDVNKNGSTDDMFYYCLSGRDVFLKNIKVSYKLTDCLLLTKTSLLYIINNEATTSAITLKLSYLRYPTLSTDPDIVAALAAHPNISISQ